MSIKQQAEEFLEKCRVIENNEVVEGIIVKMNFNTEFEVVKVNLQKNGECTENKIDEFIDKYETSKINGLCKGIKKILQPLKMQYLH